MSQAEILFLKLKRRWYVPILIMVLFFGLFFPQITTTQHQASATIAIAIDRTNKETTTSNDSYVETLDNFGTQLINKLKSVPVQFRIAELMGKDTNDIVFGKTFFSIHNHGLGEVNLTYSDKNEEISKKFIDSVNEIHSIIIKEIDDSSTSYEVKVRNTSNFQTINVIKPTLEKRVLPILAGLVLGLALVIITPLPRKYLR